jgi:hypothetical protein
MRVLTSTLTALALILPLAARAQYGPPIVRAASLAGPRVGITVLSNGIVNRLRDEDNIHIVPVITQFGWQGETQFQSGVSDLTGVSEWVFLAGGAEQNVFIPSVSWLVGFRTHSGAEFAVGPNLTPIGVSLAFAGGITYRVGGLNVPVNLAAVPSNSGLRISVLTGFNMGR